MDARRGGTSDDEGKGYIRHAGGREELYDIDADPTESLDLSTSAGSEPILTRLRQALDGVLTPDE